jgi:hypothetical protein
MGIVTGYETDIFISYAHIDNDPLIEGKHGWVDFFEELLRKRIRVRLGGDVVIFRDPQLRHFGKFSDQLASQLTSSAVFISILSPRYVESDWCLRELSEFCKQGGAGRLFKVVKTAIDKQSLEDEAKSLLAQIKDVLDYRFYRKDESSGLFTDLQPEVIPDHIPECLATIDALTQNLVELLKSLSNSLPTPASPKAPAVTSTSTATSQTADKNQITVYLAETTKDLLEDRNKVKTELLQFNYRVLPDQPLPQDAEEMVTAVNNYLQQAKLSVHLIGANYGMVLEGEERSIPHVQYELAAAMSKENKLSQLVWMPQGLAPREGSQQEEFVNYVKNSSPNYLQAKLEDLKTEIRKKLKPASSDAWEDVEEGEPVNVCLLCHEQDVKSVGPIYSHLKLNESFKVKIPLKDAQSFENQKQILQSSDAVILYYGSADEDWFVNVWRLIQRQSSAGRTRPILAKAIITGEPQTTEKDLLDADDPLVLKNYGEFTPDALAPFIEKIKAGKGGAK